MAEKETVLVTGGAGFIGSNIVDKLLEQNYSVKVLDNFYTGKMENIQHVLNKIELIKGDILDKKVLETACRDVDFILHEAALRSPFISVEIPHEYNKVNIDGTLNILEAARKSNVKRVVLASSSSIYGNTEKFPEIEDFLPNPQSPYALTKIAGEYYLQMWFDLYGLETISLRYFNVFGPRQDPNSEYANVIPRFIKIVKDGKQPTIYGDGHQSRDFTFVYDTVKANILALKANHTACGKAFNVAHGDSISLLDIVQKLSKIYNKNISPIFEPMRKGDVRKTQADISNAKEFLNFIPDYSFDQGLKKTCDWFDKNLK